MRTYNTYVFKSCLQTLFIVFSLTFTSCEQTKAKENEPKSKSDKINEIISLYSDYEGFNGSVLVAHKGEIIYKKGFGLANMEWEIPNQTDTKFQIASITKTFTAMLIMQLVAENKIDLNQPITRYLPDYPEKNGSQITIHHLLTHTSGLNRDASNDETSYNKPKDMVNQFAEKPLQFTPGERFEYSNSGYTLLGYIIETITEKPYEDVLQEKIFTPLNMKNSGYFRHRPLIKHMASGYFKGFGDFFNANVSNNSTAYAAGAIYSTVEDLFLWDQALYNETLLSKNYVDAMLSKQVPDPGYGGYYGYGWEVKNKAIGNTTKTIKTIGHSGTIDGFCALFTRIPASQSSIILLNNTRRAFLNAITTAVTGILNNESYDYPIKPLAKLMSKVIKNEGIEKGIQFYKAHKDLTNYNTDEQELIVAGYKLLHAGNAKDAAEVFKLSIEEFPNKDNPYDSYAEALMTLGKNEEAIKNYKKSLELNPKNENAVKMLKLLVILKKN